VVSPAVLAGLERAAADSTVEVLDGVGHFLPEEAPGEVADRARLLFG
jgi:pimeloyl-ACP methyl ester carboxylesterase